jgi:hypothetical protein
MNAGKSGIGFARDYLAPVVKRARWRFSSGLEWGREIERGKE